MSDPADAAFYSQRLWCTVGAAVAALGVIAGAFGAHGIEDVLQRVHESAEAKPIAGLSVPASYKYLQDFRTGAAYHLVHGVAIVLVGLLGRRGKARIFAHAAGGSFLGGVVFFSGSLYLLALTGLTWLGSVAPIGGVLLIAGWILLAIAAGLPRTNDSRRN